MALSPVLALALLAGVCHAVPSRIIGGQTASIQQYPSIVQVENLGVLSDTWTQTCGGSVLSNLYIISAANCFSGTLYEPSLRRIRAGTANRGIGGVTIGVEREINHPSFNQASRWDADISVVRLTAPFTFGPTIQQVTIISADYVMPSNQAVYYAGWGRTSIDGAPSDVLREVVVLSISNDVCRERYSTLPDNSVVTENMICAGMLDIGGSDACRGDAGGPLFFANILVGIVSWGHRCADATYPGVNTAVSPYTNWILSVAV